MAKARSLVLTPAVADFPHPPPFFISIFHTDQSVGERLLLHSLLLPPHDNKGHNTKTTQHLDYDDKALHSSVALRR